MKLSILINALNPYINQLIETVITFLKPQNKFDLVEIETALATDLPLIEYDQGKMQQMLVNLIFNAVDAVSELDGKKRICVKSSLSPTDDSAINISVLDNGPGVPENKVELLFIRRFTTRRKGHGIGLITCQKLIEAHQGEISYKYDNGAIFEIKLPKSQAILDDITEVQPESSGSPVG